jgi:hypothetical protein
MAGVILFFATIATHTYVDEMNISRIDYRNSVEAAKTALWFCLIYTASRMFLHLSTRKTAIPYLMLPASNKDKFLANCIMTLGGTFIMFIVALLGADVVQALFNLATRFTTGSITANYVESIFNVEFQSNNIISNKIILSLFWVHSIFTLGSTIFRKHSLIKTILSLLGASIILVMIIGGIVSSAVSSNRDITIQFLVDPMIMANISSYIIIIGTTIGAYYWAYRRFCKKTIL